MPTFTPNYIIVELACVCTCTTYYHLSSIVLAHDKDFSRSYSIITITSLCTVSSLVIFTIMLCTVSSLVILCVSSHDNGMVMLCHNNHVHRKSNFHCVWADGWPCILLSVQSDSIAGAMQSCEDSDADDTLVRSPSECHYYGQAVPYLWAPNTLLCTDRDSLCGWVVMLSLLSVKGTLPQLFRARIT